MTDADPKPSVREIEALESQAEAQVDLDGLVDKAIALCWRLAQQVETVQAHPQECSDPRFHEEGDAQRIAMLEKQVEALTKEREEARKVACPVCSDGYRFCDQHRPEWWLCVYREVR